MSALEDFKECSSKTHEWTSEDSTKNIMSRYRGIVDYGSAPFYLYQKKESKEALLELSLDTLPDLLMTSVMYSDIIGKTIPELENWRSFLKDLGWKGTRWKDGEYNPFGFRRFESVINCEILAELPDKVDRRITKKGFVTLYDSWHTLPIIDEDKSLLICKRCWSSPKLSMNPREIMVYPDGYKEIYYQIVKLGKDDARDFFIGLIKTHKLDSKEDYQFGEVSRVFEHREKLLNKCNN